MHRAKDTGTHSISQSQLSVTSLIQWIKEAELKPRHKLLLRMLADFYARFRRVCPSVRKIAAQCGVSRQAIHRWLNELTELGCAIFIPPSANDAAVESPSVMLSRVKD